MTEELNKRMRSKGLSMSWILSLEEFFLQNKFDFFFSKIVFKLNLPIHIFILKHQKNNFYFQYQKQFLKIPTKQLPIVNKLELLSTRK